MKQFACSYLTFVLNLCYVISKKTLKSNTNEKVFILVLVSKTQQKINKFN